MLTGLQTEQYDRIMRWWISNPQSSIATILDSAAYCCVILPRRPFYSIPHRIYHTSSSAHPGITCLCPIISAYYMRSFSHPGVSLRRTSIPTYHSATPPPPGSYCVILSPNILILLASRNTPACFYVVSWRHQDSLLHPPPYVALIPCIHSEYRS